MTLIDSPVPATRTSPPSILGARRSRSSLDGLICCAIFLVCYMIAWPFAEMGFVDDWSYVKTAEVFARTGHVVYNGFATPILGWQIAWGALFIRLFGFSFTAVKLSTLPLAFAVIFLFHAVLVRFGITGQNAILGTLTLGLSPLLLPLAASYMTDVPGLFVILLCLYSCQRAIAATSSAGSIAWLCLASGSNLVGGTARQIAWLGALVMVPSAGWILRKRRGVLPAVVLLWAGSVAGILACMRWFAHQPYSVPEAIFSSGPLGPGHGIVSVMIQCAGALLCLLLMLFPLLAASLARPPRLKGATLLLFVGVLVFWAVFQWQVGWIAPWIPHVLVSEFCAARTGAMSAPPVQSLELPAAGRIAVSVLVMAAALLLAVQLRRAQGNRASLQKTGDWNQVLWLLCPFTAAYLVLLLPRTLYANLYDRYLLALMPIAIILLLRAYQQWVTPGLPGICVLTLAVYAALAVAGTHDWFRWQRARITAIHEVRASGVPRTAIQGGFEYDGWTQIEDGGHINDKRIQIPAGSWDPRPALPGVAKDCVLDFAELTPAVQPKFTVALNSKSCLLPTQYTPVRYRTWLPPFQRTIDVWRFR